MSRKDKEKRKVKWNSVLSVTDISPRKKGDFTYHLLYTDLGISVCTSESIGERLCLFEPYDMKGYVNFCKGGSFLVLEKAKLLDLPDRGTSAATTATLTR
jgi:hypothetical protein